MSEITGLEEVQAEVSQDTEESSSAAAREQQPESAEATEASEEEGQDEEGEEEKPRKHKGGFQRRIDRLTQEKRYLESLVEQLAGQRPAAQPAQEQQEPQRKQGKPNPADFKDYDEYVVALGSWGAEQRLAQERQRSEEFRQAEERQRLAESWETRQKSARQQLKDYDEVLADADDVPMSPAMRAAIMESEVGPRLAYHLARNPADAARIAQMSPLGAARELGRLEARFAASPDPQKKTPPVSSAPEPIKPVGSKASGAAKKPLREVTDFAEYERRRKAGERV